MGDCEKKQINYADYVPTPIMAIDNNFNVIYINEMAAQLIKKESSECQGKKCYELLKTGDCNSERCALMRAMKSEQREEGETIAQPYHGAEIPIRYYGRPIYDEHGDMTGGVMFIYDQTEIYRVIRGVKETGDMLEEVAEMLDMKAGTVAASAEEFSAQVREVSGAIGKVKSNISNFVSLTSQANSSVSTTAAATEEMSVTMKEISTAMDDMVKAIEDISKGTLRGNEISNKAVDKSSDVDKTMSALISVAENIGEFVEVIDSIASQTNMLALNATIEASRAGEAGKGFAVVASEVKSLSKQTSESTLDISKKIKEIQKSAKKSNTRIEEILGIIAEIQQQNQTNAAAVEEQTSVVGSIGSTIRETESALNDVAHSSLSLNKIVSEVDHGAKMMSDEVSIISHNMGGVKEAGENIGSVALELATQSKKLNEGIKAIKKELLNFQLLNEL